jgi:DNA-cytosine methyltransferase
MITLSLFDGMSCGRLALEKAGFKVDTYYASEIDKPAIKVSGANWPSIIQVGDVTAWKSWDLIYGLDWASIDLVIGGSPCQGFSFAGKQLAFDDPRSALFFTFVDILNRVRKHNPKVKFILENVKMQKVHLDVVTDYMGVEPILINSALVSAQNRKRYYWTNLDGIEQPEDKGILLSDILENGTSDRSKALCLLASYKGFNGSQDYLRRRYFGKSMGQGIFENPSLAKYYLSDEQILNCISKFEAKEYASGNRRGAMKFPDDVFRKAKTICASNIVGRSTHLVYDEFLKVDKALSVKTNQSKASCITGGGNSGGNHSDMDLLLMYSGKIRRLTPIECERLQTVPDNYTNCVSDSQRYRMLGNGWNVDTIVHLLSYYK